MELILAILLYIQAIFIGPEYTQQQVDQIIITNQSTIETIYNDVPLRQQVWEAHDEEVGLISIKNNHQTD